MNEVVSCVECGLAFKVDEASDISVATASIQCPECGRWNYCESVEVESLDINVYDPEEIEEDTEEYYIEGYLSDDLVYKGKDKDPSLRKIGVASRVPYIPKKPVFEHRKALESAARDAIEMQDDSTAVDAFIGREGDGDAN